METSPKMHKGMNISRGAHNSWYLQVIPQLSALEISGPCVHPP